MRFLMERRGRNPIQVTKEVAPMTSKRPFTRGLPLLLVLLLLAGCLSSCGKEPEPVALVIISGYHANAPCPSIASKVVTDALQTCLDSHGSVDILVNDGAPFIHTTSRFEKVPGNSPGEQAEIDQSTMTQLQDCLAEAMAETPEVDTLAAIHLAARRLSEAEGAKRLYILDSGLATTGYLDFTQDLLERGSEEVQKNLTSNHALPDLTGVEVTWFGLGDVAGGQPELTFADRDALEAIWDTILREAGAADVRFSKDPPDFTAEYAQELPYVTPVSVGERIEFDPVDINTVKLSFIMNSADFVNRDAAVEELRPTVDYLLAHPGYQVVLAGTTATDGSNEYCMRLSLERADAAKALLVELGVPESQVAQTVGLGHDHKFHVPDLGSDGRLNEHAQENRAVLIMGAETESAQYALNIG